MITGFLIFFFVGTSISRKVLNLTIIVHELFVLELDWLNSNTNYKRYDRVILFSYLVTKTVVQEVTKFSRIMFRVYETFGFHETNKSTKECMKED